MRATIANRLLIAGCPGKPLASPLAPLCLRAKLDALVLLAGSIRVWLFYVQHQFEMTFWAHEADWSFQEAALQGSSHYDLPGILRCGGVSYPFVRWVGGASATARSMQAIAGRIKSAVMG
jgi:fatty acid desaturase